MDEKPRFYKRRGFCRDVGRKNNYMQLFTFLFRYI